MYKVEHKSLPNTRYCITYAEAAWLCKVYGFNPKRCIKPVH